MEFNFDGVFTDNRNRDIQNIKLDLIDRNELNDFPIVDVPQLAEELKNHGLLHNIVVYRNDDGRYTLISGERRTEAARLAGWDDITSKIIPKPATKEDERALIIKANIETREITPEKRIELINELSGIYDTKKKAKDPEVKGVRKREFIADNTKMSTSSIARLERINKNLIPELLEEYNKEAITTEFATTIVQNLNQTEQKHLFNEYIETEEDLKSILNEAIAAKKASTINKNKKTKKDVIKNKEARAELAEKSEVLIAIDDLNRQAKRVVEDILPIVLSTKEPLPIDVEKLEMILEFTKNTNKEVEKAKKPKLSGRKQTVK